jgi:CHAT domain-containing protein/Tfp pilus assembly protein PilF
MSLAIRDKIAPASVDVAANLSDLGMVAYRRGDLVSAEELYRRSLAIREKLVPNSLDLAASLNNLGAIARDRGDLPTAEELYRRSLAIAENTSQGVFSGPSGRVVAAALNNLGGVAMERSDFAAAQEFYRRALAIDEKLGPNSLDCAKSLESLGEVARRRGDLDAAEEFFRRALNIRETLAPDSLDVATSLGRLGDVAKDRGDRAAAGHSYLAALSIRQKLAPGSAGQAEMLHRLGLLARGAARNDLASDYFEQAVAALEEQAGKLGGADEVRSAFTAQFADYYRAYVEVLLERNQTARAFEVLERSRARGLLAMLAERDLVFAADVPPDLARERTILNTEYDRTQASIARLNPGKNAAEIDRLLARLRELRDQRDAIAQAMRKASPQFASLHYPQPLDIAGAQRTLDAGTLLLAYCVTKDKTFLFVAEPGSGSKRLKAPSVAVFSLPIGETALRERVSSFRRLIQRNVLSDQGPTDALTAAAQELFDILIKPAQALIAANDRVLISPDGPLHTLPFAALVQSSDRTARSPTRYFVEWKPVHVVVSVTVYAELKTKRREKGDASTSMVFAGFGDPTYPALPREQPDQIANPEVRAAIRRGYALEPLPASRREVEGIARLYAGRAATYVGDQATEERAKTIGKSVRYLHFASHGLLDERFPLNSALALTIPEKPAEGQANGLLQAWEIFEQMRLGADLVTLSACETGLGAEMGGEGLVGLTRAFHYAGARAVLASLWSVGDESTAKLMTRFYGYLQAGRSKDEALRAAQIDLIRARPSPKTPVDGAASAVSHPFHWAAFQLFGDWK